MDTCPYCRRPITPGDTICTSCWKSIPPKGEWPILTRMKSVGCVGWFVISLITAITILVGTLIVQQVGLAHRRAEKARNAPTPTATEDVGTDYEAASICREFVIERLKAPESAKFQIFDAVVSEYETGRFVVDSFVDAQNSFEGTGRMYYICKVEYSSEGSWELIELLTTD